MAEAGNVRVDPEKGFILGQLLRVVEWGTSAENPSGALVIDPARLKDAGITVEPKKISDAVDELVQE